MKEPLCTVAVIEAMASGFIWTLPWPIDCMACSSLLVPASGTTASKLGRPVCQFRPMPYTSLAVVVSAPGLRLVRPWSMKAVLQEIMKSCCSVLFGYASGNEFGIFFGLLLRVGQATGVSGLTPASSRAVEVRIFSVEPGASWPWKARFRPVTGALAKASTWPVLGSMATIEPFLPPRSVIAFSAAACRVLSMVSLNGFGGFGSTMVNSRSGTLFWSAALVITTPVPLSLWSLFWSASSLATLACRVGISGVIEAPVSGLLLRSTTLPAIGGSGCTAIVSPGARCGWSTDGAQCTAGVLSLIFTTFRKPL